MLPSLVRSSARARTPSIRFLGKRQWPTQVDAPHPHPSAPAEIKKTFGDFLAKSKSAATSTQSVGPSGSTAGVHVYQEFWQAPERLWRHDIHEAEIEAILSGGASNS